MLGVGAAVLCACLMRNINCRYVEPEQKKNSGGDEIYDFMNVIPIRSTFSTLHHITPPLLMLLMLMLIYKFKYTNVDVNNGEHKSKIKKSFRLMWRMWRHNSCSRSLSLSILCCWSNWCKTRVIHSAVPNDSPGRRKMATNATPCSSNLSSMGSLLV